MRDIRVISVACILKEKLQKKQVLYAPVVTLPFMVKQIKKN